MDDSFCKEGVIPHPDFSPKAIGMPHVDDRPKTMSGNTSLLFFCYHFLKYGLKFDRPICSSGFALKSVVQCLNFVHCMELLNLNVLDWSLYLPKFELNSNFARFI